MKETKEKNFSKEVISKEEINLAADTLVGDLRDAMLDRFKNTQKPWQQMTEAQQRDVVEQFTNSAKHFAMTGVRVLAASGRKTIIASVESVNIKDKVKCVLNCVKTEETMLEFGLAQGRTVLVIAADASEFEGENAPAEIDPDQPEFEDKLKQKASGVKSKKAA